MSGFDEPGWLEMRERVIECNRELRAILEDPASTGPRYDKMRALLADIERLTREIDTTIVN